MKKRMNMIVAAGMAAMLLVAGCGNKAPQSTDAPATEEKVTEQTEATEQTANGEVQMWDGYYMDDSTGLTCFVHFNEDGTYYASYFDGAVTEAGNWQLLDEEIEYSVDGGDDDDISTVEDNTMATATQAVEFDSYAGVTAKVAFVDDALVDMSFGGMANHRTAAHVPDYPYDPATDEIAIEIAVFYANNDIGSTLTLQHDKTFVDVTGDAYMDGTWEKTGDGNYELTYSDGSKAEMTVAEDGKSATLAKEDGTETELRDTYKEGEEKTIAWTLRAEDVEVEGQPMKVAVRLDAYSDNTCELYVEIAQVGAELLADQGTWEMSETMKPTFHFETAGDVEGTPDYASATAEGLDISLAYAATVTTDFGGNATEMNLDTELNGTYSAGAAQ